jgi:hypothetical protein
MYGTPTPTAAKPPGPSFRLSLILLIAGVVIAIPALILGLLPIIRALDASEFRVPGTNVMSLGTGTYVVYERTGSAGLGDTFDAVTVTLEPEDVTVTDESGSRIETYRPSLYNDVLTQTDSNARYTGALRFKTTHDGEYTIAVRSPRPTTVIVARPFIDTVRRALAFFVVAGVGGIMLIVGVVLLIVGSVRRSRYRTAMAFAVPVTPAGWYPDPSGSGRQRHWDGTRWTEHLH